MTGSVKNILITGASSGLGRALAVEYAAAGVHLYLMARSHDRLAETAGQCRAKGATVDTALCDVTQAKAMTAQLQDWQTAAVFDLVIANAGVSGGTMMGMETADQTRAVFKTNIDGVLNTVLPVLPHMQNHKAGQIALVSSLAGFRGLAGAPAYSASKNAVRAWGEALRVYLAPQGVKVSVICPGFIKTPLTDKNPFDMPLLMSPEKAARIIRRGLGRNCARIAFPRRLAWGARFLSVLPLSLGDFITARLPKK